MHSCPCKVAGRLVPAVVKQEARYTLDQSTVHHGDLYCATLPLGLPVALLRLLHSDTHPKLPDDRQKYS
ncbi:hypothetical protein AMECASPLE_019254 [Ameca splendens]|uniref:Uncharacterized protein n=1 Tax=Ameca splendens TaxID=208324 RepID=A0ABV0ZMS6_9TELE